MMPFSRCLSWFYLLFGSLSSNFKPRVLLVPWAFKIITLYETVDSDLIHLCPVVVVIDKKYALDLFWFRFGSIFYFACDRSAQVFHCSHYQMVRPLKAATLRMSVFFLRFNITCISSSFLLGPGPNSSVFRGVCLTVSDTKLCFLISLKPIICFYHVGHFVWDPKRMRKTPLSLTLNGRHERTVGTVWTWDGRAVHLSNGRSLPSQGHVRRFLTSSQCPDRATPVVMEARRVGRGKTVQKYIQLHILKHLISSRNLE